MSFKISSMENAPKDRRIVAYGRHALEETLSWATVKWNRLYGYWQCDPNEASEYDPEPCACTLWFDLPQDTGSIETDAAKDGDNGGQ